MFAPYCATCQSRQLLGPRRIVTTAWEQGGPIKLRCHCGTVVSADADPPASEELRPAS
jgi:hypothetical protein